MNGPIEIGAIEITGVQTFGGTCGMYHYVPAAIAHLSLVLVQLTDEERLAGEVETGKLYPLVLQICLAAALTHSCPHLVALPETLLHYITPYEAAGSRYQYIHFVCSFTFGR